MSIQTEITRLNTAKSNILTSIENKGVDTSSVSTLDDVPALIDSIEAGGGGGFPNGTEWTQSNITSGNFYSVYNANGIWVAGASSNGIYYSTDGKSWTQSNITSDSFAGVYYANGVWIAVAGSNWNTTQFGAYYSTDGKSWTQSNITSGYTSSQRYYRTYYANGIWVSGDINNGNGLYYSVTWEAT